MYGEFERTTIFVPKNISQYLRIFATQKNLESGTKDSSLSSILTDFVVEEVKRRGFDPERYPKVEVSSEP